MRSLQLIIIPLLLISIRANLSIYSPQKLSEQFTNNSIGYSIANFGTIPYGKQMTGTLIIANPQTNCEFQEDLADDAASYQENVFILIYRGDCKFVTKVLNAQKEGAKLAIIMDNTIERSDKIIMANDGHGYQVTIPSIFIAQQDGNKLLSWYQRDSNNHITMKIKFDTHLSDVVNMTLWLDYSNRASYYIVKRFKTYYQQIQSYLNTQSYYNLFSCNARACDPLDCYYNYTYCAVDPDGNGPSSGRQVIQQQLRQHFIHKLYPLKWWTYMQNFDLHCADPSTLQECSRNQMKNSGINVEKIISEVQNSFLQDQQNLILDKTLELKAVSGVSFYPQILINSLPYLGQFQAVDIFQLICNSLNKPPADCNSFVFDQSKIIVSPPPKSNLTMVIIICTFSLVVFMFLVVCLYRRNVRRQLSREMNDQVNQLVSQYITLYETKKITEGDKAPSIKETVQ